MRSIRLLSALLIAALLITCGIVAAEAEENIRIVCTSFPCYDFARAVADAGDEIRLLIRPGTEVHAYEPTSGDIMAIAECDLFICIGGESDAWADDILESFGEDAPQVLRLIDCVDPIEEEEQAHMTHAGAHAKGETEYDEHIWTSPANAVKMVSAVERAMRGISDNEAYAENAQAYIAAIEQVDARISEIVQNAARREMIFADRFPFIYFMRQYGLTYYAAFPSCAAESEPSAKTLAFLIDRVKEDHIPTIYTIEMSNQRTAKTIAEETGAEILTFYSGQTVTEADFSAGETYVTLMWKNADALEKGLN